MKFSRAYLLLPLVFAASCARHRGNLAGLLAFETPRFETRIEIETGTGQHADYVVADFDGDGVVDMAVISVTGELKVLIGNGTTFTPGQEQQIGGQPIWMASADFDEDGDLDLVIVRSIANNTSIWINDGAGTFTEGASLQIGAYALAVAVGDLDNDDNVDVVVTQPDAPEVLVAFGDGNGGFLSQMPLALPGGGEAFTATIADATRDGYLDLIIADPENSRLVVYPGPLPGQTQTFGEIFFELYVPGTAAAVSMGDLNGDLLDDIVVTAFGASRYVVITEILGPEGKGGGGGGGYGTSYAYVSFDILVPSTPSLSRVADVTGDGIPDLVACLASAASVCIAPGQPGGGVGDLAIYDTTGLPLRPFVGDINVDGRRDLMVLAGLGDRINLWLGKTDGTLAGARSYPSGLPLASWAEGGDFDGDGSLEVATGSWSDPRVVVMGSDAQGRLVPKATIDIGFDVYQIEASDLDGDGRTDLVVGVSGGIKLLRNVTSGGVIAFDLLPGSPVAIGTGDFPFGITVADFDRDGDFDIALCDYVGGGVHVLPGTDTPFVFGAESVVALGGGLIDLVAADFTGDGQQDLAVSRGIANDIVVLRNDGGVFSQFSSITVGASPNYLITADFNFDGRADLVVSNAGSDTVTVLFGGASGFTSQDFPAGRAPTALLGRDLTRDGIPDILVASLLGGDFRVLVGDGSGGFPLLPRFPGTIGASDAVLQDMDGDERPELMITSLLTNRISLVRNVSKQQ